MIKKLKMKKILPAVAYILLGASIGGAGATDTELPEKLAKVESDYTDLQGDYTDLQSEYNLLIEEHENLKEEYSQNEQILKEYEEQETNVEELEEQLEELQVEYTTLIEENENLEEELQEAEASNVVTRAGIDNSVDEYEEDTYEYSVWLSATGEKYHSIPNCGRMNPNKARKVSESSAISSGYEACSKCF